MAATSHPAPMRKKRREKVAKLLKAGLTNSQIQAKMKNEGVPSSYLIGEVRKELGIKSRAIVPAEVATVQPDPLAETFRKLEEKLGIIEIHYVNGVLDLKQLIHRRIKVK